MSTPDAQLAAALERLKAPTVGVPDYAVLVGIDRSIVYRAIEAGEIPSIRLGLRHRIPSAFVREQLRLTSTAA